MTRKLVRGDNFLWLTYILATLGGMYSHNTATLLPGITTLIFMAAIAAETRYRWRRLWNLIVANAILLALYAFNIPVLLANIKWRLGTSRPPMSFHQILRDLLQVYANIHLPAQAVVLVGLCALALWGWRRREGWRWIGFTLIGSLALALILLAISILYHRVFFARTIIWASIPFITAAAVGLSRLPHASLRRLILAGLLLGNLYAAWRLYNREAHEPWDRITHEIAQSASSDAMILLCPSWPMFSFNYYWRDHEREEIPIFGGSSGTSFSQFQTPASGTVTKWRERGNWRKWDDLADVFDDHAELWFIERPYGTPICEPTLRETLASRSRLVTERRFGIVTLLQFVRN